MESAEDEEEDLESCFIVDNNNDISLHELSGTFYSQSSQNHQLRKLRITLNGEGSDVSGLLN